MKNILIIYSCRQYPLRPSQSEHLWSFRKYAAGYRCYYVNVAIFPVPFWLKFVAFDLIIYSWSFLALRIKREYFRKLTKNLAFLNDSLAMKIGFPQDEFECIDLLCDFINTAGVNHVFSVAPETEWKKIYRTVDFERTRFSRVLTGYLDTEFIERVRRYAGKNPVRTIDIGYRTVSTAIWGRFNLLKGELAQQFLHHPEVSGLVTDIKVGEQYFFVGDAWIDFLLSCKYTLGVEGGSTLLDWDGTMSQAIKAYVARHPDADFDEIESACLPSDADGQIQVFALSPRHLEACATRTCQVLIEGEYNGVLHPGIHYLELKRDFRNIDEIVAIIRQDDQRKTIVDRAFADVVSSEKYSYASFVNFVLQTVAVTQSSNDDKSRHHRFGEQILFACTSAWDLLNWTAVISYVTVRRLFRGLLQRF